jgi:hypothetical protein
MNMNIIEFSYMVNAKLFLTMNPEEWSWKASTELSPDKGVVGACMSEEGDTIKGALNKLTHSIKEVMYIGDRMVNVPNLREVTKDDLNNNLEETLKGHQAAEVLGNP